MILLIIVLGLFAAACGEDDSDAGTQVARNGNGGEQTSPDTNADSADATSIRLRPVGRFDAPVHAVAIPGTDQIAVVEKGGIIRAVADMLCDVDGCPDEPVTEGRTLLDVSDQVSDGNEQGLLGLAFHPDWPNDPRLFINYTDRNGDTRVESWTLAGADASAEREAELFSIEQPYANHNGGHLVFGPDGQLYVGTGDGGSGGDPQDNAQNPDSLLGKLLRVNVDEGAGAGDPERWAIGLRNPWRFSFDAETGDLWIADVGQNEWEEIHVLEASAVEDGEQPNFGWRLREGYSKFDTSGRTGPGTMHQPVLQYGRDDGCSITGGVVYRGELVPQLAGSYLFADFCAEDLRVLDAEGVPGDTFERGELEWRSVEGVPQIASFAEVQDREVLAVSLGGEIAQVVSE